MTCRICSNIEGNITYIAREMMFGYRDVFRYFECAECNCLQIEEVPKTMNKYYPPTYYSFQSPSFKKQSKLVMPYIRLRIWLHLRRLHFYNASIPKWLEMAQVRTNATILDIGCGNGQILLNLSRLGYRRLIGVDPNISESKNYFNQVEIYKKNLNEIEGTFEFIMLHHCLEHLENQYETFKKIYSLLTKEGQVLIRIPTTSSFAWQNYRTNWIQLDAPRHFYLHSKKSIQILAERSGFEIKRLQYDSGVFQFWGSELYQKDIPYMEAKKISKWNASKLELEDLGRKAQELNRKEEGDQFCILLSKRT